MQQRVATDPLFIDSSSRAYFRWALEKAPEDRQKDAILQKLDRTGSREDIAFSAAEAEYVRDRLLPHVRENNPFDPGLQTQHGMRVLEGLAVSLGGQDAEIKE